MRGPKIIVFHIRQLFKTGIFVLAGLIIILLLIWALAPKNKPAQSLGQGFESQTQGLYIPGAYSSYIVLDDNVLYVTVTVDGDVITDVALANLEEAQDVMYPLFRPVMESLKRDILLYQTTDVSLPEDGPLTGQILLEAINMALNQAYASVINTGF